LAYDPNFPLARKYDPEKSKQLLAEAGHSDGIKTSIIVCPIGDLRDLAVEVQAYLAEVGIQTDLSFPEMANWVTYTGSSAT
jgi:peptide/nickel transport system substrate-binding protein